MKCKLKKKKLKYTIYQGDTLEIQEWAKENSPGMSKEAIVAIQVMFALMPKGTIIVALAGSLLPLTKEEFDQYFTIIDNPGDDE